MALHVTQVVCDMTCWLGKCIVGHFFAHYLKISKYFQVFVTTTIFRHVFVDNAVAF